MLAQRKFEDERLEYAKNKITTEWFAIIYKISFFSIIIKDICFDMNFSQYGMEFFLLMLTPCYFYIRSRQLGVVFPEDERKTKREKMMWALAMIIMFSVIGRKQGMESLFLTLGGGIIVVYIAIALVGGIILPAEKKRKNKLEEQWDETE